MEPQKTIRILLADDHQIMREGLASLISKESGMEVVGQAADGLQPGRGGGPEPAQA